MAAVFDPAESVSTDERAALQTERLRALVDRLLAADGPQARTLRAAVVPVSAGLTSRQLRLIQDLRPDVLTCTPSYAIYLGEAFAAEGIGPDGISLTVGVHGAEPWSEAMRANIERLLGVRALDIYGLSAIIGPGAA